MSPIIVKIKPTPVALPPPEALKRYIKMEKQHTLKASPEILENVCPFLFSVKKTPNISPHFFIKINRMIIWRLGTSIVLFWNNTHVFLDIF